MNALEDCCAHALGMNDDERWKELCAQAATEQDPKRLSDLVRELCALLDERDRARQLTPSRS
jgi:hypothetical protein